ncbi:alanine:cation symporter family protein [Bacillus licheniformis]|nr:alanine:cation symporter family protein [Bacillus licheniformis]
MKNAGWARFCRLDHIVLRDRFNAVQSNTITVAFENSFGTDRLTLGIIITIVSASLHSGNQTDRQAVRIYRRMPGRLIYRRRRFVMLMNITKLPDVISLIIGHAFGLEQAAGGAIGAALMNGIKRGLFSNEAGMGSAPNAAAAATTSHPVKQGLVQALGVFTSTLVICSSTALSFVSDAYKEPGLSGIELTQASLSTHIGAWASGFLAIMVFLFSFSTLIGNYYYGETNIEFLHTNKAWLFIYRICVLAMVIFGSVSKSSLCGTSPICSWA